MTRFLLTSVFIVACLSAIAQSVPPLERKITISFNGVLIDEALSKLSKEGKFIFSYSPSIFNSNQSISGAFTDQSVREVLNSICGTGINAKGRGNYIILTKATPPPKSIAATNATISGYVISKSDSSKLAEVSVYDKNTLTASITDQYGYFKISIDKPGENAILNFSKSGFVDTVITVNPGTTQFINMYLERERLTIAAVSVQVDTAEVEPVIEPIVLDEIPTEEKKRWNLREFLQDKVFSKNIFSKKKGGVNVKNIKDTLYREFQVSFVPFVGTNHKLSGNVVNGYSLNLLGGYSMGTRKLELGGLFNIDRGDVRYGQFAGLVNTVGGETYGFQGAGLANLTRRNVEAFQFAGLFNANIGSVSGGQFAGLFNVNGRASRGGQFAGLFNVQPADYQGSQVAGLFNISTQKMAGSQIAGLLNFGHNVTGSQIAVLNFADSIRGVPIGVMSFVSRGYHKLEFSADEVFYVNAAFRTGVRSFYNIIAAGLKPESLDGSVNPSSPTPTQENIWSFGYGVGTAPKITKWLYFNLDATANHVNKGSFTNSISLLNKLYMGFDFQIVKGFSITAGATLNGYLYDPTFADNPTLFTDFNPAPFSTVSFNNGNELKFWWGGKVGIRFF